MGGTKPALPIVVRSIPSGYHTFICHSVPFLDLLLLPGLTIHNLPRWSTRRTCPGYRHHHPTSSPFTCPLQFTFCCYGTAYLLEHGILQHHGLKVGCGPTTTAQFPQPQIPAAHSISSWFLFWIYTWLHGTPLPLQLPPPPLPLPTTYLPGSYHSTG